ncbi:MAG: hypothetical protein OXR84_01350 [Magnetovibrio sp.]|nr:hypothetical protein [Magnetovibrio sp.]
MCFIESVRVGAHVLIRWPSDGARVPGEVVCERTGSDGICFFVIARTDGVCELLYLENEEMENAVGGSLFVFQRIRARLPANDNNLSGCMLRTDQPPDRKGGPPP